MNSLTEQLGAVSRWLFVPSAVIDAQKDAEKQLAARAEIINGRPDILALAANNKSVNGALQSMNRDIFLMSQSDREAGEAVKSAFFDSIEEIPENIRSYASAAGSAVGSTVSGVIPVWLRVLLGLALVGAILYFITRLFAK